MGVPTIYRRVFRGAIVAGITMLSAGCIFPASGPYTADIVAEKTIHDDLFIEVVAITPDVAHVLQDRGGGGFAGTFTDRRPPAETRIGVGDVVSVTIFEAQAGGLFIPNEAGSRPGNFIQLPDQTVDRRGFISVPYAGLIPAAGRTVAETQALIEARLRDRAIDPQAVVAVKEQRSTQVSVLGEVNAPVKFALTAAGDRVLDAIARAGGPRGQGFETFVTLQRGNQRATVNFDTLVREPPNNVYVQPGDTVVVSRENRTFLVFGASGQNGQIRFEAERVSLAEAVAKAGGLLDERADPAAVYLYRLERRDVVERFGGKKLNHWDGKLVPVIYSLNLRDPGGFFLATKIPMRDKDLIYVANAGAIEWVKFIQFVRLNIAAVREADALKTLGN